MAKAKSSPTDILDEGTQDDNLIDAPHDSGEQMASTSAPAMDDDVEDLAASAGLYNDPDPHGNNQDMTPVGIAEQVQQAENARRGIDKNTFSDED